MPLEPHGALRVEKRRSSSLGGGGGSNSSANSSWTAGASNEGGNGTGGSRDDVGREILKAVDDAAEVVGVRVVQRLHVGGVPGDGPPVCTMLLGVHVSRAVDWP